MKIGYCPASIDDQDLSLQKAALQAAGCERIFSDKPSDQELEYPELLKMLDYLRQGDVVFIYKMNRMPRPTKDMIFIAGRVRQSGADLVSLNDASIDMTTPMGTFCFHTNAALAQLEIDIIAQHTKADQEKVTAREQRSKKSLSTLPKMTKPKVTKLKSV